MEEKKTLYALVPKQAHRELRLLSFHKEVSMGHLVRQAVEEFLAREQEQQLQEKQGAA